MKIVTGIVVFNQRLKRSGRLPPGLKQIGNNKRWQGGKGNTLTNTMHGCLPEDPLFLSTRDEVAGIDIASDHTRRSRGDEAVSRIFQMVGAA